MRKFMFQTHTVRRAALLFALGGATFSFPSAHTAHAQDAKDGARSVTATAPGPYAKDAQVIAALAKLERQFDGVLPWVAQLYDPKSGGFFESIAARDDPRWGPDIQSTSMIVKLLKESYLLDEMPADIRSGLVRYFQSRQEKSGFFFDPDYPQFRDDQRTRTRMLGMASGALESLGAKPIYPLPGASEEKDEMAAHIASKEAWMAWLEKNIGPNPGYWGRGTGSMDLLTSQGALVASLPDAQRMEIANATRNYLAKTQNPETGLWEGTVHAALKFGSFLNGHGLKYPRADAVYASTMAWYREYAPDIAYDNNSLGAVDTPRLGNPLRLLVYLQPQLSRPMSRADLLEILDYYNRAWPRFKHADGAFSRFEDNFKIRPLDRPVSDFVAPQSDINGTSNVRGARTATYELAGIEAPPLPKSAQFYGLLRARITAKNS